MSDVFMLILTMAGVFGLSYGVAKATARFFKGD